MKRLLIVIALLYQVCFFQKLNAQNELIRKDTAIQPQSVVAIPSATHINNYPCCALDFDKEVLTMEAERWQESYNVLLEKYEKVKLEIKLYQKVMQEYKITPSEQAFSCLNNSNSPVPCGDAFMEPSIPHFSNENAIITYFIPNGNKDFKLCISDSDEKLVLQFYPHSSGYGQIIIPAGKLNSGVYNYCLLADNKKMDCKKMIVLK